MALIDATWVGPYGYTQPDGTRLETGITVVQVPEDEARDSDYWQPVGASDDDDLSPSKDDK